MTPKYGPLGFRADDRYRNIPESRIIGMLTLAGWAHEPDSPEAASISQQALLAWPQYGLGFRNGPGGERLFDPIEVYNFIKRLGLDGRDGFLFDRFIPNFRRSVCELAKSDGLPTNGERRFEVDFQRAFDLRSVSSGTKLRLRAPLPLAGNYLKDLQVSPYPIAGLEAKSTVSPGRLELRMVASGEAEAILGATLSFTALLQEPTPCDPGPNPDAALYLNDREGLIIITDRIRHLAQSLAPDGAPAFDAIRAFWDYITGEFICGAIHYDQVDPASPCDWILDSGWFDCQLAAALFTALCRARAIPARVLGGYCLYQAGPVKHYWAEAWLDDRGWTPFDFLGWDLSPHRREPEWCDRFFGRLEYRMTTERFPREFTGALGVPLPASWYVLQTPAPGGVEIAFLDSTSPPVYTDTIRITK
jgi:transglutaminase-like putative cysteine protease